jgi:hypothetical protein
VAESQKLRDLPAVHEVLERVSPTLARFPRELVVAETRRAIEQLRTETLNGGANGLPVEARIEQALLALERPSLRRVINATGVVLHTNLGRAPLGAVGVLPGYSNLEYDLQSGRRGKRDVHVTGLLERLLGAPGIAVNNNAAAIFLALHEFAGGGEVVVSRGELIEIGDGFRIPDIMAQSGAVLREVGTTNRTRINQTRAQTMGLIALDCGLRISEILSLPRQNVDLDNLVLSVQGKGNKQRLVPISVELRKSLYRYLGKHNYPRAFPTKTGTAVTVRNSERDFKVMCRKAGIEGVRCSWHNASAYFCC